MKIWNLLMSNWYIVVSLLAAISVIILVIYKFLNLPTEEQMKRVREWMIWACIEAEHDLKSGTGQAKLRKVYSAFISIPNFSWVARVVTFEDFSTLLDNALLVAKQMIIENEDLAKYVYDESTYKDAVSRLKEQLVSSIEELNTEN